MGRKILTLEEAHARTGISVETFRYWRKRGEGPKTFRLGRRVVIDETDLESWIEACRSAEDPQGAA